ncbi:MAG TPA: DUF87 domain-containing protein [Chitinophagaceae bacterium]|nr:DUF87 domain-containing protein [Chitinophagaceae bacterium]
MKLFPKDSEIGVFKGFSEGGLEFHADIILKYHNDFQNIPMHGQFLIVGLEGDDEAVLGRITEISAQGKLSGSTGEDYGIRAITEGRSVPEDLREQYLKYKIDIRVLGVLRVNNDKLIFAPSHRRLPHVGSKVAFLSEELLKEIAGHNIKNDDGTDAAQFGFFALGEFIYSGGDNRLTEEPWMHVKRPVIIPRFKINQLVSRRSFVFARAGFGKSNLVKLLFSSLYANTPTVKKRGEKMVPVGTLIFDPDGEYFWPDDNDRPGLCDVPHLEDKLVVFTNKQGPSDFYQSFVAGNIKLDIRRLRPSEIISIALPAERQSQQNVQKLKALNSTLWARLVNLIYTSKNSTDLEEIRAIILGEAQRADERQDAEIMAIRSNMTTIVSLLHDPSSQMKDKLFAALKAGKICIVDISQMRGPAGLILSGIILQQIFEHNQNEFTKKDANSIPTIAVLEEAQSVLGGTGGADSPYVAWVKEGRKYNLGAVLITQQPGSISDEILSQGDNWFLFHLLSSGDLQAVKKANAHFSNDILSSLLNEPIPGNAIFWSSSGGTPYPISARILSFEKLYQRKDQGYDSTKVRTYATDLNDLFEKEMEVTKKDVGEVKIETENIGATGDVEAQETGDYLKLALLSVIEASKKDTSFLDDIKTKGKPWKGIIVYFRDKLPKTIDESERESIAADNMKYLLNSVFGENKWTTERRDSKSNPTQKTTWIILSK